MQRWLRDIWFAALASLPLVSGLASAAQAGDCQSTAMATLAASAPDGFAISQQIRQRDFFKNWIDCDDAQFDLSTAVHESTHFITADTDAFPLVGGGAIRRPHEISGFFPPSRIAKRFKTDDFVAIYLRLGKASSATDFLYLLDELNAYSHDLNAAVDLKRLSAADEQVDHRDGLAAMMAFVAVYLETAQESEPATWSGLQEPQVAKTISELWGQGERVMAASCGVPNFGIRDRVYIRQFCATRAQSALEQILGRPPVCPVACLTATPDVEQADAVTTERASDGNAPPSTPNQDRSTAGPSWIRHVIRFLSHPSEPETAGTPGTSRTPD